MKLSLMRPALVLALALGLASCGGKAGYTVAGQVSGLKYTGMELSTNGMTIKVEPPAATSTEPVKFAFPNDLEYGDVYEVKVKNPDHQTCELDQSSTNTAGRLATINVIIACSLATHNITGTVKGLTGTGLQLTNGSTGGLVSVAAPVTPGADVTFTFANIAYGQSYGISVLTQPNGQVCTVGAGGIGTMDDADIKDVLVNCSP